MSTNQLLVVQDGDNLKISGLLDASTEMRALLGTAADGAPIELATKLAAVDIERSVVEATRSGKEVMMGYINFARPIIIKNAFIPPQFRATAKQKNKKDKNDKANELSHKGEVHDLIRDEGKKSNPCPKTASITVDAEFLKQLKEAVDLAVDDDLTKAAACPFVENLLKATQDLKVDGTEVGLTAPVKVAFPDEKTRDFFLGLFKGDKKAAFDISKLADALAAGGLVRSGLVERLAELGKRRHDAL